MRELHRTNSIAFINAKHSVQSRRPAGLSRLANKFHFKSFGSKKKNSGGKSQTTLKKILVRTGIIFSLTFLFTLLVGTIFLIGVVSVYSKDLPKIEEFFSQVNTEDKDTIIVDRNGKEVYRLQGDTLKERVYIKDVPQKLRWAFLAAEDDRFYSHNGLDLFGLTRAVICNAKSRGQDPNCGGGSSITQQVVKNATSDKKYRQKNLERKIREAVLAMKTEQTYSKDEILEFYMNVVSEGGILQGVKTGSENIFKKENLNDLTLAEMAYLAAIPNQPNVFSPCGGAFDQDQSKARADYVLNRMLTLKDKTGVTAEEIQTAKEELNNVPKCAINVNKKAPHYVDYVMNKHLNEIYKDNPENKAGTDYLRGKGYTVVTALDLNVQDMLQDTIQTQVKSPEFQAKVGAQNAAGVIMDPRTGELIAMVGSRNFNEESNDPKFKPQDNAALQDRSLGSTNKMALYATAFTKGYNPSSIVPDFPLNLQPSNTAGKLPASASAAYPQNYSRQYSNRFMTMREALRNSLNMPAVSTYYMVGAKDYGDTYVKLTGWEDARERVENPSSPLGAEIPLIYQTHAYATFAAEGMYYPEKVVLEVKDDTGKVIYDNRKAEGKQVIEKKHMFLINDMGKHYWICDKDGKDGDELFKKIGQSMDFACKTGTSDNEKGAAADVAFIGYTPTVVIGMWAGNSCGGNACPLVNGASGEELYRRLYKQFLTKYSPMIPAAKFSPPAGVKRADLCSTTGKGWTEDCALLGGNKIQEWVADNSNLKEDMIEKAKVTECGDGYKLARPIDIEAGLAKDQAYFTYKHPVSWIQSQITAYNVKKNQTRPAELCALDRTINNPVVSIVSPIINAEYKPGDSIRIQATATGDVKIEKVDIVFDSVIQQTFTTEPYELSITAPNTPGEHRITVVATDSRGKEGRDEKTIIIKVGNGSGGTPNNTPAPTTTPTFTPTPTPVKLTPTIKVNGNGNPR
jgi:membrane peptidoglycan carboxypeptidase